MTATAAATASSAHRPYAMNTDQTIATFQLNHLLPRRTLNPTETYYWVVYIRSALVYSGTVDVQRFCAALHHTLQQFDWLFYRLHKNGHELYADLTTGDGNPPVIQLEIERSDNKSIEGVQLAQCLPTKAEPRMLTPFTDDVEDLQLSSFKLHIHSDGFTVGYHLNHAMHDQHSNVYLMKYLAHVYTHGADNVTLKKPYVADVDAMLSKQAAVDGNEVKPPMGYHKAAAPSADDTAAATSDAVQQAETTAVYDISFNNNSELNKLKASSPQYMSANDLINAVLLKIYALLNPPQSAANSKFAFGFVCNMRKALGLGDEAIGNFLVHPMMHLQLEDMQKQTVAELALASRQRLTQITVRDFYSDLQWYKQVQDNHEASSLYSAAYDGIVSNWSTFNYDDILYDNSKPQQMIAHEISAYKVNVISFNVDAVSQEKQFRTTVTLPASKVDAVNELANTSRLFCVQKHASE